jgi:nucleoid DNA-binding protein
MNPKTITTTEFLHRYAKKAGLQLKDTRPIFSMIEEEITKALISSRDVRLAGLGTFKKVKFRSQMMANPNNRRQRRLVLDRYYMRFKASDILKDKIKTDLHPGYQPKTKTAKDAQLENLGSEVQVKTKYSATAHAHRRAEKGSVPIKVSVKPRIPPLRWREPISALYLDLSKRHVTSSERLVKNIIRWVVSDQAHGLSLAPHQLIVYEHKKRISSLQPLVYDSFVKILQERLPQVFRSSGMWRLMINLPPSIMINLAVAPVSDHQWSFHLQKPYISYERHGEVGNINLPALINKKLDVIFDQGYGRLAIIGPRASRLVAIKHIQKILDHEGISHHYVVEHHHYPAHPHHTLKPSLRSTLKEVKTHPVLIMEHLSGADNLDHLRECHKIVLVGMALQSYDQLMSLLERQGLEANFFDLVLESHVVPMACSNCPPLTKSAVLFPALRKIAALSHDRLDEVQVFLSHPECDHELENEYIIVAHGASGAIGPSLKEQLYHLVLGQKITYDTFSQELTDYC